MAKFNPEVTIITGYAFNSVEKKFAEKSAKLNINFKNVKDKALFEKHLRYAAFDGVVLTLNKERTKYKDELDKEVQGEDTIDKEVRPLDEVMRKLFSEYVELYDKKIAEVRALQGALALTPEQATFAVNDKFINIICTTILKCTPANKKELGQNIKEMHTLVEKACKKGILEDSDIFELENFKHLKTICNVIAKSYGTENCALYNKCTIKLNSAQVKELIAYVYNGRSAEKKHGNLDQQFRTPSQVFSQLLILCAKVVQKRIEDEVGE